MLVYDGQEFQLLEIEMQEVPSVLSPGRFNLMHTCGTCGSLIWYSPDGAKVQSCIHNAGFRNGKLILKVPKEVQPC